MLIFHFTQLSGELPNKGKVYIPKGQNAHQLIFFADHRKAAEWKLVEGGDGKGERVFTLSQIDPNTVRFSMSEKMRGLMFPIYAKFIPPFDENFETSAADLKNEAHVDSNQTINKGEGNIELQVNTHDRQLEQYGRKYHQDFDFD